MLDEIQSLHYTRRWREKDPKWYDHSILDHSLFDLFIMYYQSSKHDEIEIAMFYVI